MHSREILASLTGRRIRYFAYPAGDYDRETLGLVKEAKFDAALATIPLKIGAEPIFELERVGIYSPAVWKLKLKAWGAAGIARRLGRRVG